ncbi:hypothetical protein BH09BAC2_BH09BAC2_19210 [soil metagenome]
MIFVFAALIISGCKTSKKVTGTTNSTTESKVYGAVLSGSWQVQHLWGVDDASLKPSFIQINFTDKTFTGNSGCNDISGTLNLTTENIYFNKNITTGSAPCTGYNEKGFTNLLIRINQFNVENNVLELSQDNIVLISFKKK